MRAIVDFYTTRLDTYLISQRAPFLSFFPGFDTQFFTWRENPRRDKTTKYRKLSYLSSIFWSTFDERLKVQRMNCAIFNIFERKAQILETHPSDVAKWKFARFLNLSFPWVNSCIKIVPLRLSNPVSNTYKRNKHFKIHKSQLFYLSKLKLGELRQQLFVKGN